MQLSFYLSSLVFWRLHRAILRRLLLQGINMQAIILTVMSIFFRICTIIRCTMQAEVFQFFDKQLALFTGPLRQLGRKIICASQCNALWICYALRPSEAGTLGWNNAAEFSWQNLKIDSTHNCLNLARLSREKSRLIWLSNHYSQF